ncbi:unnamed protein product [Peronospora destructor]|uniref:Uncharacterized protein n=1 Tax=Peronospora destructor TaxID=86335 RepID=A0AAV0V0F3_9STRA|nr:unnamed protein product [Peronospora destructor]
MELLTVTRGAEEMGPVKVDSVIERYIVTVESDMTALIGLPVSERAAKAAVKEQLEYVSNYMQTQAPESDTKRERPGTAVA